VKVVLLGETTVAPTKAAESVANPPATPTAEVESASPKRNVPLNASDNAQARELVGMEAVFTTDPAKMTPKCSAYWRQRRHYLTDELCEAWGVGVRPSRAGTDKRGWSLRNHVVYRFLSEDNKVLCYVGRDPEYDEKLRAFEAIPAEQRDPKKRPMKHKFPTGFHRGIELYGQQSDRLKQHPEYREFISPHGVIVVEGFNDVLALDHLGVPAVAICSNRMTEQQAAKVGRWARQLAGGKVSLMFDCDPAGDEGVKEALWLLAQTAPDLDVRIAWSQRMFSGEFRGKEPESFTADAFQSVILPANRRLDYASILSGLGQP
jgi:hypothetical protein